MFIVCCATKWKLYTKQFARHINKNKITKMVNEKKNQRNSRMQCSLHGTLSWLMGELNKQQLNIFLFGHRLLHFVSSLFEMFRSFSLPLSSQFSFLFGSLIPHLASNCRWFYGMSRFDVASFCYTFYNWTNKVEKKVNAINWHRILDTLCSAIYLIVSPFLLDLIRC